MNITILAFALSLYGLLATGVGRQLKKQRRRMEAPVKTEPRIQRTVYPDQLYSFNEWAKYIHNK